MSGLLKTVKNEDVWALVKKTDVPFSTVRSLLLRGWIYEEDRCRWVAPPDIQLRSKE